MRGVFMHRRHGFNLKENHNECAERQILRDLQHEARKKRHPESTIEKRQCCANLEKESGSNKKREPKLKNHKFLKYFYQWKHGLN